MILEQTLVGFAGVGVEVLEVMPCLEADLPVKLGVAPLGKSGWQCCQAAKSKQDSDDKGNLVFHGYCLLIKYKAVSGSLGDATLQLQIEQND